MGEVVPPIPREVNAPRLLMRTTRDNGGQIVTCESHYDHERDGRVVTLTAFWPKHSGYSTAPYAARDAERARYEGALERIAAGVERPAEAAELALYDDWSGGPRG